MLHEHIEKLREAAAKAHDMFLHTAGDAIKDFLREDGDLDPKTKIWHISAPSDDADELFGLRIVRIDDDTIDGHPVRSIECKDNVDLPWVASYHHDHVLYDITDTDIVDIVRKLEENHERKAELDR